MALTLPTPDEIGADFEDATRGRRPSLSDWTDGSTLDALRWAASLVGEEILLEALRRFEDLFFSTRSRDALVALIQDRFQDQLHVQGETAARGTVTLARPTADGGDVVIVAGDEFWDADLPGIVFVADGGDVLVGTSLDVPVTCATLGVGGNLPAESIDTIGRTLSDSTITITHGERMAGGAPEETVEELKALVRLFYQSLRKGTVAALEVGARQVDGVRVVVIDETHVPPELGGYIRVLVGDAEGDANSALSEAVDAELADWAAGGVLWLVEGVVRQAYPVEVTIRTRRPLDFGPLLEPVQAALLVYSYSLQADATLFISQLERTVINVSPADKGGVILDADVRIKVGEEWVTTDVTPDAGVVPRLDADAITFRRGA